MDNWDPLLTDWERGNLEKYRIQWHAKYGHYPEDNPDAVVVVGQSAEHRFTGSHKDGSLPTLLKGSGITRLYSFHRKRWLTAREKFALMGWPANDAIAGVLKSESAEVDAFDTPHALIGHG